MSDAHPDSIREFVFFDRWSTDEGLMRLGLSYGEPNTADGLDPRHPSVRLSQETTERARTTLRHITVRAPFLPAGTAVLLEKKVYLGAPIHIPDTVLFRVLYPKNVQHGLFGISRERIRGVRLMQTRVDQQLGTYSVQFWERLGGRPPLFGMPKVHLIYGLDKADAEEWVRLLSPPADKQLPLPEWAIARGSLENCRVSSVWQLVSAVASVAIAVSPVAALMMTKSGFSGVTLLAPIVTYAVWRAVYEIPARTSREWFAAALRT